MFLQQGKPCEDGIHWIILYKNQSKIFKKIFIITGQFDFSWRIACFLFLFFFPFFAIVSTRYQLNNCALNQNNTASFHERFDTTKINNILLQGNFDV